MFGCVCVCLYAGALAVSAGHRVLLFHRGCVAFGEMGYFLCTVCNVSQQLLQFTVCNDGQSLWSKPIRVPFHLFLFVIVVVDVCMPFSLLLWLFCFSFSTNSLGVPLLLNVWLIRRPRAKRIKRKKVIKKYVKQFEITARTKLHFLLF